MGLCVFSNNTSLPQPICLCICDRFAHTLTHWGVNLVPLACVILYTHTHFSPLCLSSTTSLSSSGVQAPLRRGPLWRGAQFGSSGGSPFCVYQEQSDRRSYPPVCAAQQEKVAELFSVGCRGRTVRAQTQRYNVRLSRPSVKSSFKLEVIDPHVLRSWSPV